MDCPSKFREHVIDDMKAIDLDSYFVLGGELSELGWRTFSPRTSISASTIASISAWA